ncbi:MAG TPA: diguanylate cyclase [Edaphobacter sp.]|nr:diguanylate cyclase [Edaphobacter sp.]
MTITSQPPQAPIKSAKVIPLLILCAIGALLFTAAGGVIVYSNTQHLVEMQQWINHSQTVLTNIQTESQRLDRIAANLKLFKATGDSDNHQAAEQAALSLQSDIASLQNLVQDNLSQSHHIIELRTAIQALTESLTTFNQQSSIPYREIEECRNILSVIRDEEQALLKQRSDESHTSGTRSLISGIGYLSFSMVVVVVLFSFLIRDAYRRREFEQKLFLTNGHLEATVEELELKGREAALLKGARDELHLCVNSAEAEACTVRHLAALVPGSAGAILIINNSRSMLEIASSWNTPASLTDGFAPDSCCGLRAGRTRWRLPGQSEIHCSHFTGTAPDRYACIPLAAQGDTLGFVYLECPTAEVAQFAHERLPQVNEMVELASMAIAGLNLRAKLENQSIRDGLTHLFNRHFMAIALERELHRAARRTTQLALLMMDVDHFKAFNDTFGHEAGDAVLREVAECFRLSVRNDDVVCRYGGEEFVIILPETNQETALERAELIRNAISKLKIQFKGEPLRQITLSIGVAMFPVSARDASDLVRAADLALYKAKHSGRDQVCLAQESSITV